MRKYAEHTIRTVLIKSKEKRRKTRERERMKRHFDKSKNKKAKLLNSSTQVHRMQQFFF